MELAGLSPHPSPPLHLLQRSLSSRSFISPLSCSLPFLTRHTSTQPLSLRRRNLLSRSKTQTDEEIYEERDYEEEESTSSRKPGSVLSLNNKPSRNLSLLNEYEMEELEFDPSHKSGLSPLFVAFLVVEIINSSLIEPTFELN